MTGIGPDPQGCRELLWHLPGESGMEGVDGNSQFWPHHRHRLPGCHIWFPGGLRHRDRPPRFQTTPPVNSHEI